MNPPVTRRRVLISLYGVVLTLLTIAAWQFRFERAGPDLDLRLGDDSSGWTLLAAERIDREDDSWTLLPGEGAENPSASAPMPGLDELRFARVRLEAAWQGVTRRDGKSWWSARVSLAGRNPEGRFSWPADGDLINAEGDRGWHPVECVLDLPPEMGEPYLFINNLAATGTLQVRNLTVTPVRQRPWVPAATVVIVFGWILWVAGRIGPGKGRPRQCAAALGIVAAGWYLVFPQPNYHARPLPGGFALGREIPRPVKESPPGPVITPVNAPLPAAGEPPPPAKPHPSPATAGSPAPAAPEPRTTHRLARAFRDIDRDLPLAHLLAFAGFGAGLFLIGGVRATWALAVAIAVSSEIIPNLLRREFKGDDAADLLANLAGLAIAAIALRGLVAIRRRRRRP